METNHYLAKNEFKDDEAVAIKWLSDGKDERVHDHDFVEIVYIIDGRGAHYVNGVEYAVQRGDLVYINYGCTHGFKVQEKLIAYNIMVKVDYFQKELISNNTNNIFSLLALTSFEDVQSELDRASPLVSFHGEEQKEIEFIFKKIQEELANNYLGKSGQVDAYMNILLTNIFRKMLVSDNTENEIIPSEIIDYIQTHCGEKLTLKALAEQCFYNPSYFSRLFKKAYNMTLTEFIMEQRLKKSCDLLRNSELSVDEIAVQCGFADKTGFYTRFKQKYGCTPGDYKKSF
ncbi:MAG: AraC family transcriptional regulator [Clostridia bacterium]|nr:AraC family transcriptional regulator [Clostridia bacterium]